MYDRVTMLSIRLLSLAKNCIISYRTYDRKSVPRLHQGLPREKSKTPKARPLTITKIRHRNNVMRVFAEGWMRLTVMIGGLQDLRQRDQ